MTNKKSPLEQLKYNLLNPLYNTYKENVPVNMRMYIKNIVNPTQVTENNFTKKELDILRNAVKNSSYLSGNYIGYSDYPTHKGNSLNYSSIPQMLKASFSDPAYAMQNTIGRAKIVPQNNGSTLISDRYDFEPTSSFSPLETSNWSPTFQILHNLGARFSNQLPIDINLGKLNPYLQ